MSVFFVFVYSIENSHPEFARPNRGVVKGGAQVLVSPVGPPGNGNEPKSLLWLAYLDSMQRAKRVTVSRSRANPSTS